MKFIYNNRIYNPVNLEKKLKKLGIEEKDILIIEEQKNQEEIDNSIQKYYFKNKKTGYTITSIYPNLKHLNNVENYEKISNK